MVKFSPGQIMLTQGALAMLEENKLDGNTFLTRHLLNDWGDMDKEDIATNNREVKRGGRLMSSYNVKPGTGLKLWIITERNRSFTTLLLPDEY